MQLLYYPYYIKTSGKLLPKLAKNTEGKSGFGFIGLDKRSIS